MALALPVTRLARSLSRRTPDRVGVRAVLSMATAFPQQGQRFPLLREARAASGWKPPRQRIMLRFIKVGVAPRQGNHLPRREEMFPVARKSLTLTRWVRSFQRKIVFFVTEIIFRKSPKAFRHEDFVFLDGGGASRCLAYTHIYAG